MQSNLSPRLVKFNDVDSLKQGVSDLIASHAISEIRKKGIFTIALSGGSMPQTLSTLWERSDINWSSVIILFADERCVTLDHPDSNFYGYKSILFDKIPIPESNIISIDNETNPEESALSYENRFLDRVPSKSIDLVLLGIGPDGHVASLFPSHPLLSYAGERYVVPIVDSPKPPSCRITFTLPTINNSSHVIFIATGASKSSTIGQIFQQYEIINKDNETECTNLEGILPAALIRPQISITWVLDNGAAAEVSN